MAEVTYYFNHYSLNAWDNDPDYMVDNILTNYASTDSGDDEEYLDVNTCPGTDLGTITKVEVRAYAYGDGGDRIDLKPYFYLSGPGDIHQTVPGTGPPGTWGGYVDITSDPNAPSPWTWDDVKTVLQMNIYYDNVGKSNMMYCAKVEIRVTYTPSAVGARTHAYIFG